jgi:catechol 2,3-dioxygenase-like lactoylglutathione lyase family enzyme
MSIIKAEGIHHITLNGANRTTSIEFWQNILGMPLIFEQPNLDHHETNHLYFDIGNGQTITVFTEEHRIPRKKMSSQEIGSVHHLAFSVSQTTIKTAEKNLIKAGYATKGIKNRGFMDSLYFRDPLGLLIELASYKFTPPDGQTYSKILVEANKIRLERNGLNIEERDVRDAINNLVKNN